jgi:glycyl-tRNA synthetase beta subunit
VQGRSRHRHGGRVPRAQGVLGGYLARAQGEHPAVADAIRDHYKPVGQGDEVPTAPVTVAVSLADKLDTIRRSSVLQCRRAVRRIPSLCGDPLWAR